MYEIIKDVNYTVEYLLKSETIILCGTYKSILIIGYKVYIYVGNVLCDLQCYIEILQRFRATI